MIHGKVEINDKPIFGWQAIRTNFLRSLEDATYACEVYDFETKETARFLLDHYPPDGAAVLVRKIWEKYEETRKNLTP